MKQQTIRLSFDIPESVHMTLKSQCALARISMKEYLNNVIARSAEELEEKNLEKRLEISLKQSREGDIVSLGSFEEYINDEI